MIGAEQKTVGGNEVPSDAVAVALIGAAATIYPVVCTLVFGASAEINSDSASYLLFHPDRTLGYPIFLKLVGVRALPVVQLLLYTVASVWLGFEALRFTRSPAMAFLLTLSLFVNPELNKMHLMVMTESLFIALLAAQLAGVVRFMRTKSLPALALVSIAAGLAAAVRPTGYCCLLIPLLLLAIDRGELRRSMMPFAIIPMMTIVAAERTASHWMHADNPSPQLGAHVFAKAAMIEAPAVAEEQADPLRRQMYLILEREYEPVRRLIAEAPTADIRRRLAVAYENCIEYDCFEVVRSGVPGASKEIYAARLEVGLSRIMANPWGYAELALSHYVAMWTFYSQTHPDLAPEFRHFVSRNKPLPFESLVQGITFEPPFASYTRIARPAIIVIGLATAAIALVGFGAIILGSRDPFIIVGAASGFLTHVAIVFSALFGIAQARYTIAMWPAMMAAILFTGSRFCKLRRS